MKKMIDLYLSLFHFWMKFPEKIRFILVGGYNSVISYLLYLLFLWLFGSSHAQIALLFSFFTSSPNSYLTQKFFVFNTRGHYLSEYYKCLGTWGLGYFLNAILLAVLIRLELNPRIAQAIALVIVAISNYIFLKYIAFHHGIKFSPTEKTLLMFFLCHFLIWSIIPCLRQALPLDTLEAIFWGTIHDWGTNKHPPLSGVMAYGAWILGGRTDISLYVLNQICILTGFYFIFQIAKMFLSETKALLATLMMEGIIYYNFQSVEFNVNIVSLALWPICTYFFLRAIRENKWTDWTFLGLFSGINLLNKYVCGILLLSMGFYLLFTKQGRKRLCGYGPYLAGMITFLTILPHILWLFETNFIVVDYFLGRGNSVPHHPINHLIYPVRFLLNQTAFCLPVLAGYFIITRKSEKQAQQKETALQLFFLGILPLLITTIIAAILGIKLKTMWGFPLLYLFPVCLFYFIPHLIKNKQIKYFVILTYTFMVLFAIGYLGQIAFNKNKNFQSQPDKLIPALVQLWHQEFPNRPLELVGGHTWWTSFLYVYHPETKNILYHMKPEACRWFNLSQIPQKGVMVFSEDSNDFSDWQTQFPTLMGPYLYQHITQNWFGKSKVKNIYYGFIKE